MSVVYRFVLGFGTYIAGWFVGRWDLRRTQRKAPHPMDTDLR